MTASLVEFVQVIDCGRRTPYRQPTFQESVPILCRGACPMLTTKATIPLDIDIRCAALLVQREQGIV